ncbi:autotransporter-associated beta strand repeat-containing protein [Luteolibacter arcticus]|uniref:Autotransporter-associated beta strand repeat-containing protein n=1 Tax=Luteolibacter arcticus TaxID=1581411 RepID=A0ABT3GMD8_9BACT|nr:autotransporter-associated beta strand repeat-containing protein [Luteolibacter arcticus]MCW1924635.1 autotransporter-associated beta strand repeat-containing protein [Luteolibacter arcticus]
MTSTKFSILLPLALPAALLGQAGAVDINAVTNGDWMAAATWSDNAVPVAGNAYFVPNAIAIDGDARTTNQGSSTRAFDGGSLTIQNGGTLFLDSIHNSSFPTWTYTIPSLTLQDGSSVQVRGGAGTNFTLTNGFAVAPSSTVTINHSVGNYDQRLTLGAITGPATATIQIIASQFSTNSGGNSKDNYANVASSAYAGNWFLDSTATMAERNVRLRADALNALGTGTVTVGRQAILESNATGAFDSLSGITLQNDKSQLKFNNRDWSAPAAGLTVTNGTAAVGTAHLSLGTINQAGGAINLTVGGTKDGKLITTGNADFTGGAINLTHASNPAGKSFDVVTYGGTLVTAPFIDTGDTGRVVATVNNGSGTNGKVTVSFAGVPVSLTWLGNETGFENDWDSNVALNWNNGGSPDKFRNYDHVTFGNTTGSTTPNVIGTLLPGSMIFNHSTNDYTLGGIGSLGGTGTLSKSGTGMLTINTANTFSGGSTINDGRVRLGSNTALGTGPLTINGGSISSNGTTARSLAVPVAINASVTLGDVTDNGGLSFTGVITDGAGSFAIAKQGAGALTLTGANTYDGGTTMSAGKIRVGNNAALGTGPLTMNGGGLSSDSGTARTLANAVTIGNSFSLGNLTDTGAVNLSGPITLAGNATINAESAAEMTFSNVISGTGNLAYNRDAANPTARLNLNNTGNTFTGNLTITSGRLRFAAGASSDGSFGNTTNKIIFDGTPVDTFNNNEGTASLQQSTGAAGTIGATREVIINEGKEGTFTTWGSQTFTVNAPVTGAGRLRKDDVGTLLLTGNNTYSGGTRNTNGIIRVTNNSGLGTGDVTIGAVNNTLTARVDLEGVTVPNNFILSSAGLTGFLGPVVAAGGSASTINGNVTISSGVGNGGHIATTGTGSSLRINGQIIVLNGVVPNIRAGTVILAGGGTYPRLDQGQDTIRLGANNGISSVAQLRLAISAAGTLDLNGFNQTLSQLNRATTFAATVTNSAATPSVLSIDGTTDHSYNGAINNGTGGLSLVKKGSSTFTLAAATTYTGGTSVEGGTLRFNAATGNGPVTVTSTGTLGGTGPISGAVAVSGTLAPGNSAGTLSATSSVTFGPGSAYAWEVADWTGVAGTGWDLLNAANLAFTATPASKLTIVVSGTAANFTEGPKTFVIANSTNAITGFDPAAILVQAPGFTGTGSWSVQATANSLSLVYAPGTGNPFSTWASANGVPANPALDSDGDGIANGIEFVIGGNPAPGAGSNSNGLLPTITTDATYLNFTYRRTDAAASMPLAQQPYVQYGSTLAGWTKAEHNTNGVLISEVDGTPDLVTVKIPRALTGSGKLFARLRVDLE